MSSITKRILSYSLLCLLAGCATTENYTQQLNGWHGDSLQHLRRVWGEPTSSAHLPNGHLIYMYTQQQIVIKPTAPLLPTAHANPGVPIEFTAFDGNFARSKPINLYCRTWFEADARGQIISTRAQGNHCVASPQR